MVIRAIYPQNPSSYLEPPVARTYSIFEILPPVYEKGTLEPYYESYFFWTKPENRIMRNDLEVLYRYQFGNSYQYCSSSDPLSKKWYTKSES